MTSLFQLRQSRSRRYPVELAVTFIAAMIFSFYGGVMVGIATVRCTTQPTSSSTTEEHIAYKESAPPRPRFPRSVSTFAKGAAIVDRNEFLKDYDTGYAPGLSEDKSAKDVLIIYQHKDSLPVAKREAATSQKEEGIPKLSTELALQNCDVMNVFATKPMYGMHQCLAVVGQLESHHIGRYMRIDWNTGKPLNHSLPLVKVGRGQMPSGNDEFRPPHIKAIQKNWEALAKYFKTLPTVLEELGALLTKMTGQKPYFLGKKKKSVVVMVSNYGQSELLANFVCNARSKDLDTSRVLVICTDKETFELATNLGLHAYHDYRNFNEVSKDEAETYGDKVFRDMMVVKVVAVQLVNYLGYNVLFQDVDIVWYNNPIDYFSENYLNFDMMFQDDGARSIRFAPYEANSGFYFVRKNVRTTYLLTTLLYQGDFVLSTNSHQQALIALMSEASSLYGLRVKTMPGRDFPGGFHYHRDKRLMKAIAKGETKPTMFHMSWTENKANKVLFMKQMGFWHLKGGQCMATAGENILQDCCLAEPRVECSYRDKASMAPCHDSPLLDKGSKDFWEEER